jgi:hypothetical protein
VSGFTNVLTRFDSRLRRFALSWTDLRAPAGHVVPSGRPARVEHHRLHGPGGPD